MNRTIYFFIFLGLPCFALATSIFGVGTFANKNSTKDVSELVAGKGNLLVRNASEGHRSSNDVILSRVKRQGNAIPPKADDTAGKPNAEKPPDKSPDKSDKAAEKPDEGKTEGKPDKEKAAANPTADEAPKEAASPAAGGAIGETRWITYLFLLATAILFLLLSAVVLLLAYYILSTRILNKNTCKEIELQCRCDDCDKENDDDC